MNQMKSGFTICLLGICTILTTIRAESTIDSFRIPFDDNWKFHKVDLFSSIPDPLWDKSGYFYKDDAKNPNYDCSIMTCQRSKKPVGFTIETSEDNKIFTTMYHGVIQKFERNSCCQFSGCKARYVRLKIDRIGNPRDLNIYEVAFMHGKGEMASRQ